MRESMLPFYRMSLAPVKADGLPGDWFCFSFLDRDTALAAINLKEAIDKTINLESLTI